METTLSKQEQELVATIVRDGGFRKCPCGNCHVTHAWKLATKLATKAFALGKNHRR